MRKLIKRLTCIKQKRVKREYFKKQKDKALKESLKQALIMYEFERDCE